MLQLRGIRQDCEQRMQVHEQRIADAGQTQLINYRTAAKARADMQTPDEACKENEQDAFRDAVLQDLNTLTRMAAHSDLFFH